MTTGTNVKLAANSLTFECPAAVGTHIFVSGVTSAITSSSGGPFTAGPGTTYDPTTGAVSYTHLTLPTSDLV